MERRIGLCNHRFYHAGLKAFCTRFKSSHYHWNGRQPGVNEAKKLGAKAFPSVAFKNYLNEIPANENIFVLSGDKTVLGNLKKFDPGRIVFIDTLISEMRVLKSELEVEYIRKAIGITAKAFNNVFTFIRPDLYEYEIEALFNYEYTRNGTREAFKSICGSGLNSTILHYDTNNKLMKDGELLLMDVGAEFNGYAADITRTIPVNGKFTKSQLELYNLVLKAQLEGIKLLKPGYRLMEFHNKCSRIITDGLFNLGLITDTTKTWQKNFFILYRSGHYLGLNVHDVGKYEDVQQKNNPGLRPLLPGMVITIEPGIYINPGMLELIYEIHGGNVPKAELDEFVEKVGPAFKKYANIGIRIEDDILITAGGNEILSAAIPKQPEVIERLMTKK